VRSVEYDDRRWRIGRDSEQGWTKAAAPATTVRISLG
jgi:hypothetical protein